jgi:DNA repair photolyase
METKSFKGKAIYNPSGKAKEYSYWACNFYNGCSNGCEYCYCKKGILSKIMGGDVPVLKKCFKDETHALEIFEKELLQNKEELQKHGLFFSFSTDPMLPETIELTIRASKLCVIHSVPVKILTKVARVNEVAAWNFETTYRDNKHLIAFGFTLTGHDELEKGASTNQERIEAMKKLHNAGFKTFASIEPIVDFDKSYEMIIKALTYCDLFKVGLMSGKKYDLDEADDFIYNLTNLTTYSKFYIKEGLSKLTGLDKRELPNNFVGRDFNIFNNKISM